MLGAVKYPVDVAKPVPTFVEIESHDGVSQLPDELCENDPSATRPCGREIPIHDRSSEMYVFMLAAVSTSLTDHVRGVLQVI